VASALKTGIFLTVIGLVIFIVSEFIPQHIAKQICESDTKLSQSNTLQECVRSYTLGFASILAAPGMVLVLVGLIIVIMAAINRLDNKRLGLPIGDDWGRPPIRRF
jgi:uncharacterized membrane protein